MLFIFVLVFSFSIYLLLNVTKFKLFPSDDGLMTFIQFETKQGTPLSKTSQLAKQLESIIEEYPDMVRSYVTNIGERKPRQTQNFVVSQGSIASYGNILMHMTPVSSRDLTSSDFVKVLKKRVENITDFEKIVVDAVNDGPPVGRAITVRFVGNDDTLRNAYADTLIDYLESIPGLINIEDTRSLGKTQLNVTFNQSLMAELGLTAKSYPIH